MTVKQLKEILERVNPELDVYVWDNVEEIYKEATYANVEELFLLDCGEQVLDEDDEPVMFETFTITP